MRCHPTRWLWGLIPIAMLSWLAVHAESDRIERDLEQRSRAALAAAGHDWASVAFSGREGLLVGRPASARQRDDAAALVRDVWGVRTVETRVALSPAAAGLPVASLAAEIAPRSLNDVTPGPVVTATAAELASAPPNTGHAVPDQAPATTVHARDQAEPAPPAALMAPIPEQKPAAAINAPTHVESSPPAAAADGPRPRAEVRRGRQCACARRVVAAGGGDGPRPGAEARRGRQCARARRDVTARGRACRSAAARSETRDGCPNAFSGCTGERSRGPCAAAAAAGAAL